MDPDMAKTLLTQGATLVLLDVPTGTDIGIDMKSWNTGENFKGIKMIPPGVHFVYYSAVDETGQTAPRVGFFHDFQKCEFLVKRWDIKEEEISLESVPEETIQRLRDNLKELDRYLGPYPFDMLRQWMELTNKIIPSLMARCSPLCGYVRAALELEPCSNARRPRGGIFNVRYKRTGKIREREQQLLPDLKPMPGTELRITEISDKQYPDDATPSEITRHYLDSSYVLQNTLKKLPDPIQIIGEMQFLFICFLVGQSFDAFEQWKKYVELICNANSAIPQYHYIYIDFLHTLEIQLVYVAGDLFCDIVTSNNFMYRNLHQLFGNIQSNAEVNGRLKSYAKRFQDDLTKRFLWDFTNLFEEMDDEAPVVVSLNADT